MSFLMIQYAPLYNSFIQQILSAGTFLGAEEAMWTQPVSPLPELTVGTGKE